MKATLRSFSIAGFDVQSYFDEAFTRRLFDYAKEKKILGRTAPPRKGFIGMANKLLWEKAFTFEGTRYVVQGGGKQIAFCEFVAANDTTTSPATTRECTICQTRHPKNDLVTTDRGAMCEPCYTVWAPACAECGRHFLLPDDIDPDEGPFLCEICRQKG